MSLISVEEARERILSQFKTVTTEIISLELTPNRVLAIDIIAEDDLPLFNNSSMDGFALRATDSSNAAPASPLTLRVVADIPAGSTPTVSLAPGEAARIMTGAQLPEGADAVIPVEDTDFNDRSAGTLPPETVTFSRLVKSNENVRPRGMDVR
ncbi:MAG TPA: molybdopterin molybdenumtransferase MoeA, partial [Anaerolineae bacterium]|nr:molybdopterin molybdenumtransferase MoeA [Anaerolineae bacterium]